MESGIRFFGETAPAATPGGNPGFNKSEVFREVTPNKTNLQLNKAAETAFLWAGIICVIVIVIAGLMYVFSAGNAGRVSKAKSAIIYALIGLVLVASAFGIVKFVLGLV